MRTRSVAMMILMLGALATGTVWAQVHLPPRAEEIHLGAQDPEAVRPGAIMFRPGPRAYGYLFRAGSARLIDFPLPGGHRVDLEIVSSAPVHRGTRFFVRDEDGLRETSGPSMRFFRGNVSGDPDSLVSLNLFEGRMVGFVRTGGEEYSFGPRSGPRDRTGDPEIVVFEDAKEEGPAGRCEGDETALGALLDPHASSSMSLASSIDGNTLLLAHLAVEGTVEWVNKHGGVTGAQAYTLNLIAQVSAIYENDLKVQLQVPYLLMNTAEPDGYSGESNSTATILSEMRTKWNGTESLRNVFRTAAHVFGTYPSGGAGRAYVNALCRGVPPNSSSFDFGVSLLAGNGGSWERGLVAHELGHNFASPHSHCYVPELDHCYGAEPGCYSGPDIPTTGTIMSYCGSSIDTFHQRARDEKLRPAAEAAFPACMEVAGMPGSLSAQGGGSLDIDMAAICGQETLRDDDGGGNGAYGYGGTSQAAWAKRFTPSCYPFKLTNVAVRISNSSVASGRPLRILIYTDPSGSGNPVNATLIHSEDTAVQTVSSSQWNQYALSAPVILGSGDYYIGFFDLEGDDPSTFIMDYDNSRSGDSYWQANSTSPGGFGPFTSGTWMISGQGRGVDAGSLSLSWGLPCNDASVPNQDFAVYQGNLGFWTDLASLTCSTGQARSWLIEDNQADLFWIVVPQNSANEGSYGQSSSGERLPAAVSCKPQAIGACE